MRFSQGDLAILSAETYNAGPQLKRAATARGTQRPSPGAHESPRKRPKLQPSEEPERDDDEKKRARGRPRLNPKDETAAERRRTQIRLAQRAYRNRKENAIHTLEVRVQSLKETNEEMSNVFMKLHDWAVSHGLLERAPDFGHQLQATTEKFLALARRSSEEAGEDDNAAHSGGSPSQDEPSAPSVPSGPPASEAAAEEPSPKRASTPLYGGFVITHDDVSDAGPMSTDLSLGLDTSDPTPPMDYEIVTYPTLDNASFPFGITPDFNFGDASPAPPLYSSLPLPKTYAAQEFTFGRRLHRIAAERALRLITMPNPPPKRFARVFGFCLLFESQATITKRLRDVLDRRNDESLFNWKHPFLQLGGAGTHIDPAQFPAGQRFGNQGTVDVLKPRNHAGFGVGPYDAKINEARDSLLNDNLHISLPGFHGDFYDCDEIEMYLQQRGVAIPSGADYVTVTVDPGAFEEADGLDSVIEPGFHANAPGVPDFSSSMAGVGGLDGFSAPPAHASSTASSSASAAASIDTSITNPSPPAADPAKAWDFGGAVSSGDNPFMGVVDFNTGGTGNMMAFAGIGTLTGGPGEKRKIVTIDVNVLISEMVDRTACLGRTPALRKDDINAAFWRAIQGG